MPQQIRMTIATRAVLLTMLDLAIADQDRFHGYQICQDAGLTPGVVYPILARLKKHGWLVSEWESSTTPGPRRNYYRFTPEGAAHARALGAPTS